MTVKWHLHVVLMSLYIVCTLSDAAPKVQHVKAVWISEALSSLAKGEFPRVKAVAWWHENFDKTFLRIDSSGESLTAYREAIASPVFTNRLKFMSGKLVEDNAHIYHGANPGFGGTEDNVTITRILDFEKLANKKIAWAYFSNNWFNGIRFPRKQVETIIKLGKTPFIRLMPRSDFRDNGSDPLYTLDKIIKGDFDTELITWAQEAKSMNVPILVEFGCEANGNWFPWSGIYNGGDQKDGYGDPKKADGPERFRDAYKHIVILFRKAKANNITWFFHIDAQSAPNVSWNDIAAYYPGNAYIDWIGISVYGAQVEEDMLQSFRKIMNEVYPKLLLVTDKPIAIVELGVTEFPSMIK